MLTIHHADADSTVAQLESLFGVALREHASGTSPPA
jgi:hypothetical protein